MDIRIELTDGLSVSVGANNIFDVYPEPTRDLVDEVTTFSRLFSNQASRRTVSPAALYTVKYRIAFN